MIDALPPSAAERLRELRQQRDDAALLARSDHEEWQSLHLDIQRHRDRLRELQMPRGQGGPDLPDDDVRVLHEQRRLDQKTAELVRRTQRRDLNGSRWNNLSAVVTNCETCIRTKPNGAAIVMRPAIEPNLKKGETVIDALERLRRRARELQADLARVRAAPWPSGLAKERMRKQIDQLAEAGRPIAHHAIDHGEDIAFATTTYQVPIANVDPSAIGFAEVRDALALVAWLHRDTLTAALDREIDEVADDKAALTREQRQKAEAQILADVLATEREECALIEAAQDDGITIDYRVDCDPRAVLGIAWVSATGQ
ncbi:hypothetical protein [Bradyrhizobium macuxiense]|uniref:hypothetical protein n=1 Tax=Bradyrhizobium macuxiense TaxID=1755647 RepID=UPI0010A96FD9|nr:hypothetical protein [Bradyrhizobium macuxiense]